MCIPKFPVKTGLGTGGNVIELTWMWIYPNDTLKRVAVNNYCQMYNISELSLLILDTGHHEDEKPPPNRLSLLPWMAYSVCNLSKQTKAHISVCVIGRAAMSAKYKPTLKEDTDVTTLLSLKYLWRKNKQQMEK